MLVHAIEFYESIANFMNTGGPVLTVIIVALLAIWTLIIERLIFFATTHRILRRNAIAAWDDRSDKKSWFARQIREMLISEVNLRLNRTLNTIQTLVTLFPLLGLLGTVWGMISVFDSMMDVGMSNSRPMADGISKAIIPTLVGMAGALSGLIGYTYVKRYADTESQSLYDQLRKEQSSNGHETEKPSSTSQPRINPKLGL